MGGTAELYPCLGGTHCQEMDNGGRIVTFYSLDFDGTCITFLVTGLVDYNRFILVVHQKYACYNGYDKYKTDYYGGSFVFHVR